MCKNWREKGQCRYGDRCLFAHGYDELTQSSVTNGSSPQSVAEVAKAEAKETSHLGEDVNDSNQTKPDTAESNKDEPKALEFVLSGEVDDLLSQDALKVYLPN
jgi:hypothetical protein